jgi:transposase
MLTIPPSVRIYAALGATDLRRGMDSLSALVRERFGLEPLSGHLFLFRNRRGDRLKILVWDRSGFWVLYKRLERGTFAWPTSVSGETAELRSSELMLLLSGAEITHTGRRRWYDAVKCNAMNH